MNKEEKENQLKDTQDKTILQSKQSDSPDAPDTPDAVDLMTRILKEFNVQGRLLMAAMELLVEKKYLTDEEINKKDAEIQERFTKIKEHKTGTDNREEKSSPDSENL